MPRRSATLRPYHTVVRVEGEWTIVRLYTTDIVKFRADRVIYYTGGYETPTTARRMEEAARQFHLPPPPSLAEWRRMGADTVTIPR